jgi:shikimate kinase
MRKELIRIHEARERKGFIFLIGFMGTGKSSVGRALKELKDLPLIEMDESIEKAEGMPISRIFETRGQEAFRDMETDFLAGLCGREGGFVSCGGGAVLRERNRVLMRGLGTIVLLTASPETIYERLKGGIENRPNIRDRFSVEGISELMEARRAAYTEAAGRIIATDGLRPAEIAGKILEETGSDDFV